MNLYIHNLGCDKNRVDGETLAAGLAAAGHTLIDDPDEADHIIVNTCGFIEAAKSESIETILRMASAKKVAVVGCLAKRYARELANELTEVELISGLAGSRSTLNRLLKQYGSPKSKPVPAPRLLSGPGHTAALKITEGCSNRCAYCAIPLIRGPIRSRSEADILREAKFLIHQGVKELLLVGQDITAYKGRRGLPKLLRCLSSLSPGFKWIRLMYCHPSGVTDELIEVMKTEKAVIPYIDLPVLSY